MMRIIEGTLHHGNEPLLAFGVPQSKLSQTAPVLNRRQLLRELIEASRIGKRAAEPICRVVAFLSTICCDGFVDREPRSL